MSNSTKTRVRCPACTIGLCYIVTTHYEDDLYKDQPAISIERRVYVCERCRAEITISKKIPHKPKTTIVFTDRRTSERAD